MPRLSRAKRASLKRAALARAHRIGRRAEAAVTRATKDEADNDTPICDTSGQGGSGGDGSSRADASGTGGVDTPPVLADVNLDVGGAGGGDTPMTDETDEPKKSTSTSELDIRRTRGGTYRRADPVKKKPKRRKVASGPKRRKPR